MFRQDEAEASLNDRYLEVEGGPLRATKNSSASLIRLAGKKGGRGSEIYLGDNFTYILRIPFFSKITLVYLSFMLTLPNSLVLSCKFRQSWQAVHIVAFSCALWERPGGLCVPQASTPTERFHGDRALQVGSDPLIPLEPYV